MPSFVSRLLYSQTQSVLNAFAKEVQFGQEKCAAKCANCTRIWGKLELLSHCSTSHNHGGLEPLKAPQLQTKNPRRSEGLCGTTIRTWDTRIFNPLLYQLSYSTSRGSANIGKSFRKNTALWVPLATFAYMIDARHPQETFSSTVRIVLPNDTNTLGNLMEGQPPELMDVAAA